MEDSHRLFDKNAEFKDDVFRNIVSLRKSQDLYDDINDGDESLSSVATFLESRVKKDIPLGLLERGFHYTTAIAYPFETDPFMESRYGDGKFPIWYGSLEFDTCIYETVYHMIKDESDIEIKEIVIRERAVYKATCDAILIDLRNKAPDFPLLVFDNYEFTQSIGRKIHQQGSPGLLAPSARCKGNNAVIFNINVLDNPRVHCYLTYKYDPRKKEVIIERNPGITYLNINANILSRDQFEETTI